MEEDTERSLVLRRHFGCWRDEQEAYPSLEDPRHLVSRPHDEQHHHFPLNKKIEYNEENGKLRVSAIRIPGHANLLNVFGGVKNNQPLGSNAGELMFDAFGNVAAQGIEKFSSIPVKMKQMNRREMARFSSHIKKAEEMYAGRES